MKRAGRYVVILALSAAVTLGAVSPASAVKEKVGGGSWEHGFSGVMVYSNYYHSTKTHRSSVTTQFDYYSSGWKSAGLVSYASLQSSLQGNQANWDVQ